MSVKKIKNVKYLALWTAHHNSDCTYNRMSCAHRGQTGGDSWPFPMPAFFPLLIISPRPPQLHSSDPTPSIPGMSGSFSHWPQIIRKSVSQVQISFQWNKNTSQSHPYSKPHVSSQSQPEKPAVRKKAKLAPPPLYFSIQLLSRSRTVDKEKGGREVLLDC